MEVEFDSSYQNRDRDRRRRHGCVWEPEEMGRLKELFLSAHTLHQMCELLERPSKGILPKLCELRCLTYDNIRHRYYLTPRAAKYFADKAQCAESITIMIDQPTANIDNITGPIVITEQVNLNGVNIKKFSDSALYGLIAAQEAKVKELQSIEHKPKRLLAEIEKRNKGIEDLVAYLDRDEKAE